MLNCISQFLKNKKEGRNKSGNSKQESKSYKDCYPLESGNYPVFWSSICPGICGAIRILQVKFSQGGARVQVRHHNCYWFLRHQKEGG